MPSHTITNNTELIERITYCRERAAAHDYRALAVIELADAPVPRWLTTPATEHPSINACNSGNNSDRADLVSAVLGQEHDFVLHDWRIQPDPSLLAARAGTIRGGGVMVLIVSTLQTEAGGQPDHNSNYSYFDERLARLLRKHAAQSREGLEIIRYSLPQRLPEPIKPEPESRTLLSRGAPGKNGVTRRPATRQLHQDEQDNLLSQALRYLHLHVAGCIVIEGRRGRGKSTLLARIAESLDRENMAYVVTAANRAAISILDQNLGSRNSRFVPVAEAMHRSGNYLLVDEAANLPLATLVCLLHRYRLVIFASTAEGYESSGRAFATRFSNMISQVHPHCLVLRPECSWRWATADPLEAFLDKFLVSPHLTGNIGIAAGQGLSTQALATRRLTRAQLASDDGLLERVYGLLSQSHYQTTSLDLKHLLDSATMQVWVQGTGQEIHAALLLSMEGAIDAALHEPVVARKRRLHHQLLPQLLAQSANLPDALGDRYARVVRIVVAKPLRRQGLGSRLLCDVEALLSDSPASVDAIGASFADDASSTAFWQANGYTAFHRGYRKNPRTGKQAVAVLKAYREPATRVLQQAQRILLDNEQSASGCSPAPSGHDHILDQSLLERFVANQRSWHDTRGPISRMCARKQSEFAHAADLSKRQQETRLRNWIAMLLQKSPRAMK